MSIVFRYDRAAIAGERVRLPSGGVRLTGELTKSGVFEYQDSAGKVWREWRPPEEVSKADSLASIEDLPITIGHPPLGMSADSFGRLSAGHVRGAQASSAGADVLVRGSLVAGRKDAVEGLASGKYTETSMGYRCTIDETPGVTPDGKRYDRVQRAIEYNHCAILPPGEARLGTRLDSGAAPALRLDAAGNQVAPACCAECEEHRGDAKLPWDDCMAKAMKEYGNEEQAKKVCGSIKAKYGDSMKTTIKRDGKTVEVDAGSAEHISYLEAERDAASARADAAGVELTAFRADAAKAARASLESEAGKVLGKEFKADGKTDRQIREAVITKAMPKVRCDGKDDVYVGGLYEAALAQLDAKGAAPKRGSQSLLNAFSGARKDATDKDGNSDDEDEEDEEPAFMKKAKDARKKADSAWERSDHKGSN